MAAVTHTPRVHWSGHVTATLHELAALRDRLADALTRCGWEEVAAFRVLVCADEAAANALTHGSLAGDSIWAAFRVSDRNATVIYRDTGSAGAHLPSGNTPPNQAEEHGRGLILMRLFSDRLRVQRRRTGTAVQMTFTTGERGDQ